jgi:adenylyl- and sulfurtransferase ThiI
MYGFIVETDSNQSLKRLGDKLILSLYKDKIIAKYNIFGKKIFIETSESLTKINNLNGSFAPAIMSNSEQKEIYDKISKVINRVNEPDNFAIKVIRKGEHKYTSTELARNVAGAVFDKWPNIKVNLEKPQLEVIIQIINNRSLIYARD